MCTDTQEKDLCCFSAMNIRKHIPTRFLGEVGTLHKRRRSWHQLPISALCHPTHTTEMTAVYIVEV